jgi:hypothetical protein
MLAPGTLLTPLKLAFPNYKIVSTIRSQKDANAVRAAGADEVVIASFEELNKMKELASKADVVINTADADNLALVKVLIQGLEVKAKTSKDKPVYIHTSGTGVIFERPDGTFFESKEYNASDDGFNCHVGADGHLTGHFRGGHSRHQSERPAS